MSEIERAGLPIKKIPAWQILFLFILMGLLWWEFYFDVYPIEAIEYYDREANLPESIDLAFLSIHLPVKKLAHPKNYNCWLPDESRHNNCISVDELDALLNQNKKSLDTYASILDTGAYSTGTQLKFGMTESLELSKQLTILLWKNKSKLTASELATVSQFLHYWKTVSDEAYLNFVAHSLAIISYGLAYRLFVNLASIYPELPAIYRKRFKHFPVKVADQNYLDRINVGEFNIIDSFLCISGTFAFSKNQCEGKPKSVTYKPGRTLSRIFDQRFLIGFCNPPLKEVTFKPFARRWRWMFEVYQRPGNFEGRMESNIPYNTANISYNIKTRCEALENYRISGEKAGLLNLYFVLSENNYTSEEVSHLYQNGSALFTIPLSKRRYSWDDTSSLLGWRNPDPELDIEHLIPYRE